MKVEQTERSAREERASSIIPTEIREAVEKENEKPVVDPPNMERRGGPRVLRCTRA